jgi:hypothetical protein
MHTSRVHTSEKNVEVARSLKTLCEDRQYLQQPRDAMALNEIYCMSVATISRYIQSTSKDACSVTRVARFFCTTCQNVPNDHKIH